MDDIEAPTYESAFAMIWCWLFHSKARARTGRRRIKPYTITYEIYCAKCKQYDRELVVMVI